LEPTLNPAYRGTKGINRENIPLVGQDSTCCFFTFFRLPC